MGLIQTFPTRLSQSPSPAPNQPSRRPCRRLTVDSSTASCSPRTTNCTLGDRINSTSLVGNFQQTLQKTTHRNRAMSQPMTGPSHSRSHAAPIITSACPIDCQRRRNLSLPMRLQSLPSVRRVVKVRAVPKVILTRTAPISIK